MNGMAFGQQVRSVGLYHSCFSIAKILSPSGFFQDYLFVFGLLSFEYDMFRHRGFVFVFLVFTLAFGAP